MGQKWHAIAVYCGAHRLPLFGLYSFFHDALDISVRMLRSYLKNDWTDRAEIVGQ